MTQREIDKRVGLKGRTRQFTFPVSESKFSGDRVMFNDTGSITLGYSFDNKNGIPTVDTDLIHLSSANERYYQQQEHFTFSDIDTKLVFGKARSTCHKNRWDVGEWQF